MYCSSLFMRSLLSTCRRLLNPCCVVRLGQGFVHLVYLIGNGASKGHKSFAFLQNNLYVVLNTWNTPNWEIIQNIFTFDFQVWTETLRIKSESIIVTFLFSRNLFLLLNQSYIMNYYIESRSTVYFLLTI